jgi:fructose-1,6-bisphosphatase/inositol monophosphatase family enzyme
VRPPSPVPKPRGIVRLAEGPGPARRTEETTSPSATPDPERFVEILRPAVRQAAAVARALEGRVRNRPKVGEGSEAKAALTLADSAAQEAILVPLLEHFPDVTLEAEEDTPSVLEFPGQGPAQVVIDPIDGTLRSYLEERGPYACMVGLCVARRFEAALVALPREGLFFDAVRGKGAHRIRPGGRARPWRAEATGSRVLVSHEMPAPVLECLERAGYQVAFGCGGAIAVAPLIPGVRAGLRLATSPAGISIRGRIGLTISREAGALVAGPDGRPFPEEIDAAARALLVVAEPTDVAPLAEALAAGLDAPAHICV